MSRYKVSLFILLPLVLGSCKLFKKKSADAWQEDWVSAVDTAAIWGEETVYQEEPPLSYQPSRTRTADLIHTRLDIRLDWEKQQVIGTALLHLKPYAKPIDSLTLDARGMEIRSVQLQGVPLKYTYDSSQLNIRLDRVYTKKESFKIEIRYVARPNQIRGTSGEAIRDDKGFYFIDPLDTIPDKPRQAWTQGETQASSCWFPTIDAPNERQSHDIYVTVEKGLKTLSNGELIVSNFNNDGTRTDHWRMSLPHAPYLTMLAVGNFAVVTDDWRDTVELEYWVDPEYQPYAQQIFGNTPEMLEFYSKRLGVTYPWPNYKQIVVHDFVSGAMENTTAVVHFDRLQRDSRALLDETYEDIIAHELFHHWFGDLVTCESWSNLPLNESFATYGEYLWNEHKYGRMYADFKQSDDRETYYQTNYSKQVPLVRYEYATRDELFDGISYQKGGLILHMLRNYLGDEIFFESLQLYLNQNRFKSVEVAQLRMAFEEVSGEDLNWFFDQWFFTPSHPELQMSYSYQPEYKELVLEFSQQIPEGATKAWIIPLKVAVHTADSIYHFPVKLNADYQTFVLPCPTEPLLIIPDADRSFLAPIQMNKPENMWSYQWNHATRFRDYMEVLDWITGSLQITESMETEVPVSEIRLSLLQEDILRKSLDHPFYGIRLNGLLTLGGADSVQRVSFNDKLELLALQDSHANVRATALNMLIRDKMPATEKACRQAIHDSSYSTAATAISGLSELDSVTAMQEARKNMNSRSAEMRSVAVNVLATHGDKADLDYLLEQTKDPQNGAINAYSLGIFLQRQSEVEAEKALPYLKAVVADPEAPWFYGLLINVVNGQVLNRLEVLQETYEQQGNQAALEKTKALIDTYSIFQQEVRDQTAVQMERN